MDTKSFSYLAAVEVFLLSPDRKEVLLLERASDKKVLPGYWAGLGGKMDSRRIESPQKAALREMTEESGYSLRTISGFRQAGLYSVEDRFGRWLIFEFTAIARRKIFSTPRRMEEGILSWVRISDLPKKKLIPDLKDGLLEGMLRRKDFLWVTVGYDAQGRIQRLSSRRTPSPD